MLQITIAGSELFNDETNEFLIVKDHVLQLEHSLVSLSKWESKWCKPFLVAKEKSVEESLDYVRCMTLTQNVDDRIYGLITTSTLKSVTDYISAPMTATTFVSDPSKPPSREIVTAEIIYYWMVSYNIPFECQKWHLNRLLTLIQVCNLKNASSKKMSTKDIYARNKALNEARRSQANSRG